MKMKILLKRLFTKSKFPTKSKSRAEQKVEQLYDIKVMDGKEPGKKLLILAPKDG